MSYTIPIKLVLLITKAKQNERVFNAFQKSKNEGGEKPSAEQMQAVMKQWQNWIRAIAAQGKYSGTNRLSPEGKTIKPNNVITDGPYAEVKEVVGGYLLVKANSFEEVVEMAKTCPALQFGGNVEVRSVMPIEYNANAENFLDTV